MLGFVVSFPFGPLVGQGSPPCHAPGAGGRLLVLPFSPGWLSSCRGWNTYTLIQRLFHRPLLFEFRKKTHQDLMECHFLVFLVCNSTEFKGKWILKPHAISYDSSRGFFWVFCLMKIPDDGWRFCAPKVVNKRKGTKQGLLVFSKHQFLL